MDIFNHIVVLLFIIALCVLPTGVYSWVAVFGIVREEWQAWRRR